MSLTTENVSYERQNKILDPDSARELHTSILGVGTVGSWAATCLVKAGFKNFHLVDLDQVEAHNLPSQAFDVSDLGSDKVDALEVNLAELADDLSITTSSDELLGGEQFNPGVIVCALDSMEMRKNMFELSAKNNPNISLWVDFRMGGNTIKGYAFDPNDTKRIGQYEKTLYSDESASEAPCGGKTFSPVGALVGAFITQILTKHLREGDNSPFYLEMDFDRFDLVALGLPKVEEESAS